MKSMDSLCPQLPGFCFSVPIRASVNKADAEDARKIMLPSGGGR